MKKWHVEGIVSHIDRSGSKLEIPNPGQQTLWSQSSAQRKRPEFIWVKALRTVKELMFRQL
ncbi:MULTISPECIES: hypothetical protein [Desulfosediminicola]|uniref:hypothetical protein n=1 Tax=Desulfosediminicola TaxID=2886823 RepID=UPI0010AC6F7D|nr:hypothetical protein [Desulfosediminicola ganghwensis]